MTYDDVIWWRHMMMPYDDAIEWCHMMISCDVIRWCHHMMSCDDVIWWSYTKMIILESYWDHLEVIWNSSRNHLGVTLGWLLRHSCIIKKSVWAYSGMSLQMFLQILSNIFYRVLNHFHHILSYVNRIALGCLACIGQQFSKVLKVYSDPWCSHSNIHSHTEALSPLWLSTKQSHTHQPELHPPSTWPLAHKRKHVRVNMYARKSLYFGQKGFQGGMRAPDN